MWPSANGRLTISRKTAFGASRTNKRLFVMEIENTQRMRKYALPVLFGSETFLCVPCVDLPLQRRNVYDNF